jgi:hypothetical protein
MARHMLDWESRIPLDVTLYNDDVLAVNIEQEQFDATSFGDASPQYVGGMRRLRVELTQAACERIGVALLGAFREPGTARSQDARELRRAISLGGLDA